MTFALAFLAVTFVLWRRRPRPPRRVLFFDMMRLRGVPVPRDAREDVAAAERRCAACSSRQLCEELMREGGGAAYKRFCPNAPYIEWLRAASLQFS